MFTVLVEFFLFADQPVHPQTVVGVEDDFLVFGEFGSVLFKEVVTFLVLPQLKQVLRQQQNVLSLRLTLEIALLQPVLSIHLSIIVDETPH